MPVQGMPAPHRLNTCSFSPRSHHCQPLLGRSSQDAIRVDREGCVGIALQGAMGVSQGASAKLMRFAAALQLDAKHHQALVQSAIARNMAVGNYGCGSPWLGKTG